MKIAYALQNVGAVNLARDVGASVPLKALLRGLENSGLEIEILALRGQKVVRIRNLATLRAAGMLPQGFSAWRAYLALEHGLRTLQRALRIPYFAAFDSLRFFNALTRTLPAYDLCHEHNGLFSIGAAAACATLAKPYVLTFDADLIMELDIVGKPLKGLHRRVAEFITAYSLSRANAVLCVSDASRRHLVRHWQISPDKIHVLPNGVDTDMFRPGPDNGPSGSARVAFVGAFQPWHGLDLLVEAFAAVLQAVPYAELLLVGDGPARAGLERAIELHGVARRTQITGFVPQARVPELLAGADVAVLPYPSLPNELWFSPLKLYEYMAAGKAIVASGEGQVADVIEDGQTGILVRPGSVPDLAQALIDLLQNHEKRRRLGGSARRQAVERHSWNVSVRRLEEIYRKVLEEKKQP